MEIACCERSLGLFTRTQSSILEQHWKYAMQQLRNSGDMDENVFASETIEEDKKVVLPDGLANDFTASTRHISSMRANRAYGGDPEI